MGAADHRGAPGRDRCRQPRRAYPVRPLLRLAGANDFEAGGVHAEKAVTGSTDLFTKQEFDPWRDELEAAFDAAELVWSLNSCQFEEETGFWHYEWDWEVFA